MKLWSLKKPQKNELPPEAVEGELEPPPVGEFTNHGPAIRPDFDPKEIWDLEAQRRAKRERAEKNQ